MKKWAIVIGMLGLAGLGTYFYLSRSLKRDWEPVARQRLIEYLEQRFESKVEIGQLDFRLLSGNNIEASGQNFKLRFESRTDIPPILEFEQITLEAVLVIHPKPNRLPVQVIGTAPKGQHVAGINFSESPKPPHARRI